MRIIYLIVSGMMLVCLLISCTVNENRGLIQISNQSVAPIKKLKIGTTLLASYVGSGATINYWYYSELKGKLQSEFVLVKENQADWTITLKPGYWVYITGEYDEQLGTDVVSITVYDENTNQLDYDEWRK